MKFFKIRQQKTIRIKLLAFVLLSIFGFSCQNKPAKTTDDKSRDYFTIHGETQGTFYSITYQSALQKNYQDTINALLHKFDMSLSTYKPNSLISKINQGDTSLLLDNYFIDMFNCAHKVFLKTDGRYDITIAPIVNAWGFGFTKISQAPDSATIDSLMQFVGMDKMKIVGRKLICQEKGMMVDGNSLAQGQSVDMVCDFFKSQKVTNYLVEIGGEVRGVGKNAKGEFWRIGIDKPIENALPGENLEAIMSLENKALATSGNYRKIKLDKEGKKYSHSINSKTGFPEKQNILSATIIAPTCMEADAYATACMVSGLEKSKIIIESDSTLGGYFIYANKKNEMEIYVTKNIKSIIKEQQK